MYYTSFHNRAYSNTDQSQGAMSQQHSFPAFQLSSFPAFQAISACILLNQGRIVTAWWLVASALLVDWSDILR